MLGDYDNGHFKRKWNAKLSKFDLEDNNWVKDMYDKRNMWATTYVHGFFLLVFGHLDVSH